MHATMYYTAIILVLIVSPCMHSPPSQPHSHFLVEVVTQEVAPEAEQRVHLLTLTNACRNTTTPAPARAGAQQQASMIRMLQCQPQQLHSPFCQQRQRRQQQRYRHSVQPIRISHHVRTAGPTSLHHLHTTPTLCVGVGVEEWRSSADGLAHPFVRAPPSTSCGTSCRQSA